MKKVLHLIKEYRGNYPLLNEYVRALPPDAYSSIICYMGGAPDGKNKLDSIVSQVIYLGLDKKQLRRLRPDVILTLYKIIKSEHVDIVHCHRHKATVIGAVASSLTGVRNVISHVHGLDRTRSKKRYLTNWLIFKLVKKIIAVSNSVRQDIINTNRNLDPDKVVTVRNGIDMKVIDSILTTKKVSRSLLEIPPAMMVFGTVGRLTATKGQSYLIEAFADITKKFPQTLLVMIGEGHLHNELKNKAEELGISQKVLFAGYRTNVHELLRGFDVFVLPSIAEGLSIALLEAMATQLPVIASAVGGIPEVVTGDCGLLVPAKDPRALAQAMEKMCLMHEAERSSLGIAARKRVEEAFTTEIMHKSLRKVYDSLL